VFVTRSLARLRIFELEEALELIFSVKLGQVDQLLVLYKLLEMSLELQLTLDGGLHLHVYFTARLQKCTII
jgi:hypothetical protein